MNLKAAFKKAEALAIHADHYAGERIVGLMPFRTKRNGETAIRFRWETASREVVGGFRSPFTSVDGALKRIASHAAFRNGNAVTR